MNGSLAFCWRHYAGKFPLWLAPVQVKVLPISDKFPDYAKTVFTAIEKSGYFVAEVDDRNEKIAQEKEPVIRNRMKGSLHA
jgi:threonyl-tRNA synthetase